MVREKIERKLEKEKKGRKKKKRKKEKERKKKIGKKMIFHLLSLYFLQQILKFLLLGYYIKKNRRKIGDGFGENQGGKFYIFLSRIKVKSKPKL